LENGANGFMFSVSETTLSILKELKDKSEVGSLNTLAIVPYAFEYVQMATQLGGPLGIARKIERDILTSKNFKIVGLGLKGIITGDPSTLLKTYVEYELSRIKSYGGKYLNIGSVLLHQVVTDMLLAWNASSLFKSYVDFLMKRGITPGFNTGNFTFLVDKFREWKIDLNQLVIAAPFNSVGFQMVPSKDMCEKSLETLPSPSLIAISVLAAGYVKPVQAAGYLSTLHNVKGVAVGVSKEMQAEQTFKLFRNCLV
jgi:hypothetical protein